MKISNHEWSRKSIKVWKLAAFRSVSWRYIASLTTSAVSSSFGAHYGVHSWNLAISFSVKLLLLLLLCQPSYADLLRRMGLPQPE